VGGWLPGVACRSTRKRFQAITASLSGRYCAERAAGLAWPVGARPAPAKQLTATAVTVVSIRFTMRSFRTEEVYYSFKYYTL
jgi:hypothetical protein